MRWVEYLLSKPGCPGSIPGGIRDFNMYPGTGYVFFVCVVSGSGLVILLITDSGIPAILCEVIVCR